MNEILRMAHLIAIAMGTGMAVSHYVMLRASAGHDGEAGRALALARRALGDMTTMVVIFIWITGVTLMWSGYSQPDRVVSAWFYAKLGFAGLLTAAHVMQRMTAARAADDLVAQRRKVERWVSIVWLSALCAICLAVVSFAWT